MQLLRSLQRQGTVMPAAQEKGVLWSNKFGECAFLEAH